VRRCPMPRSRACLVALALVTLSPQAGGAADDAVVIPPHIATFDDGRAPIETLYRASLALVDRGWAVEVVTQSAPAGTAAPLPVIALLSPGKGPAIWILAGIHGEEPAGPIAVASAIDSITSLGEHRPVVLLPLLNPQGYARNWRYLNVAVYDEAVDGQSVGDSSHLLPSAKDPARSRSSAPSSPEADAITAFVLRRQADYPVEISIDLHEDNLIDEGYVYSQGVDGAEEALAIAAVGVLRENDVPIKRDGQTRFEEPIAGGIVGPVMDSSIDELMSAKQVTLRGKPHPGPGARAVLVLETPAALPLAQRVAAQAAVLRMLPARRKAQPEAG
jgi:Succinylglutamate desuccinylase / Aspartoacylase family